MSDEYIAYSCDETAERLTANTVYEAVIECVDGWAEPPTPESTVKVTAFRRFPLPSRESLADTILDNTLESLDEEYADPEGDPSENTAIALRDDALAFADAVRAKYTPWACEPAETWTVNVAEYVPSDWIAGTPKPGGNDDGT